MFKNYADIADKSAITLSILCLAHCALPIILYFAIPFFAGLAMLTDEIFHVWLLVLIMPISLVAIGLGYRRHRNATTLALALLGLGMISTATMVGHDLIGHSLEIALTALGSVLVIYGHIRNIKLRNVAERFPLTSSL